ncbi:MAG TPA: hypothetical protein VL500_07185 [Candidatus Eisenbacteria bacterium]|nr:hypothetical protein [Candidatus Eisenbacteria bacterium]
MARTQRSSFFAGIAIIAVIVGLIAFCVTMAIVIPPSVDEKGTQEAVARLGFTDARIVERYGGQATAWQHGCGEGEMSGSTVEATGAQGRRITFLVCCGGAGGRSCSIRQPVTPR